MTRAPKNPDEYCLTAFNSMKANFYRWEKPETCIRSMTRIFYVNVHDSGKDAIGLISEEAMKYKIESSKKKTTDGTWVGHSHPFRRSGSQFVDNSGC